MTTKKITKKESTASKLKDIEKTIAVMTDKIAEISILLNQTVLELNDNGLKTEKIADRLGIK